MAVVAFSFGAFGDILAVIELGVSLTRILVESTDSSHEYQMLISELKGFTHALDAIRDQFLSPSLVSSTRNALTYSISLCHNILLEMQKRLTGYAGSLQSSIGIWSFSGAYTRIRKAVGWTLFAKEELVEYRRRLSEQLTSINTVLEVSNQYVLNLMLWSYYLMSVHRPFIWFSTNIQEAVKHIRHIHQRQIPKHPHAFSLNKAETITLLDLQGGSLDLPMGFCASHQVRI